MPAMTTNAPTGNEIKGNYTNCGQFRVSPGSRKVGQKICQSYRAGVRSHRRSDVKDALSPPAVPVM